MEAEKIKNYCQTALEISYRDGVQGALAFLIGEKFSMKFQELKKRQSALKFLYPNEKHGDDHPLSLGGRAFKLSYALTLTDNYKGTFKKVAVLKTDVKNFAREILQRFELAEIEKYLNSYPRLAIQDETSINEEEFLLDGEKPITSEEIYSEVEDIFLVEEMKKLFLGKKGNSST